MKTCSKCQKNLPLSEFYKHKGFADGHLNKCKDCARSDAVFNRWKNIDRYRAYDKIRGNRQPPEYQCEYRKKNPEKYKAHSAVNNAIRDNRLTRKSCEVCGEKKVHGHHDDYTKPLDVRWLCPIHHSEAHHNPPE